VRRLPSRSIGRSRRGLHLQEPGNASPGGLFGAQAIMASVQASAGSLPYCFNSCQKALVKASAMATAGRDNREPTTAWTPDSVLGWCRSPVQCSDQAGWGGQAEVPLSRR
jgi:hypothetical protein